LHKHVHSSHISITSRQIKWLKSLTLSDLIRFLRPLCKVTNTFNEKNYTKFPNVTTYGLIQEVIELHHVKKPHKHGENCFFWIQDWLGNSLLVIMDARRRFVPVNPRRLNVRSTYTRICYFDRLSFVCCFESQKCYWFYFRENRLTLILWM
jgi:hypothetical protein